MSSAVKVVLGIVVGLFGGFVLWFVAAFGFIAAASDADSTVLLFFAAVAPLVAPAVLLAWKATRAWAVGLLIGTAVSTIGLSGLCGSMIGSV
jgi:hypothetical protein